ncbi:MAG TPA: cytochrome b/b6 domain-containing protein [Aliidongia sp.]|uniref:cytochrome b n=1 Tax=Aliidongia sp. TaxID=1914230 RepID=UPI002DDD82F7|nr:cytochrome b/b6 domain-containing protein [Aliidongia sp.]HEV2676074.1 cytochrome b/b6 domain-containing protein [Aliidongia sp.]
MTQPPARHGYGGAMRAIHWITLALLVGAYALAWSIDGASSRDQAAWLRMVHRSFGLTILLLTVIRLGWRQVSPAPALPDSMPWAQRIAAKGVAILLYVLLFLQPLLGLAASQAHGDRVGFFGLWTLPSVMATDRALSRQLFALHGTVALVLLALIALHAGAALHHHFIRRDDLLRGMLPSLRRSPGQSDLPGV